MAQCETRGIIVGGIGFEGPERKVQSYPSNTVDCIFLVEPLRSACSNVGGVWERGAPVKTESPIPAAIEASEAAPSRHTFDVTIHALARYWVEGAPLTTSADVTSAELLPPDGQGGASGRVALTFSESAALRLRDFTSIHVGRQLVCVVYGVVEATPWALVPLAGTQLVLPFDPSGREAEVRRFVDRLRTAHGHRTSQGGS